MLCCSLAYTPSSLQYGLLKQWTDYLVSNTLQPKNQYVLPFAECGSPDEYTAESPLTTKRVIT